MTKVAAQHRHGRPAGRFDVGDRVVHPHHGAGEVVSRGRRRIHGTVGEYLEIELASPSLRIIVPVDAATLIGLRPIVDPRKMQRIIDILRSTPELVDANWSQRQKLHRARLKSGDVLELAAVLRDLAGQAVAAELSASEGELYERSRRVLASELQYVLGVDAQHATAYIDEHTGSPSASDAATSGPSAQPTATATPARRR